MKMKTLEEIQQLITQDKKLHTSIVSFTLILIIFLNLNFLASPIIGITASALFFLINATFLAQIFFEKQKPFLKLFLGTALLTALLGIISWTTMIIYNLDTLRSTIALAIFATFSASLSKLKTKQSRRNKTQHRTTHASTRFLNVIGVIYLLLAATSFYLLFTSRSGEIYTVWQFIHPMFMPLFFATTFLLIALIFSPAKTEHKLLFIIIHSILSHSLFVIIFPAGDISGQQMILGRTRLVFDNVIYNGWPPSSPENILEQIYSWFRPTNFQTALSVMLARMFSLDILWVHLFLIPILWGIFTPLALFMITKTFTQNDNIPILSSLLISLFPLFTYWGTISVPNSLGFIFFGYSMAFMLKYLHSNDAKTLFLLSVFSFVSLLGHLLTGILSFSIFLLAVTFRRYKTERKTSPMETKTLFATSFVFCASLLPLSLIYLKFFYPIYTYFSLERFSEQSIADTIWLFLFSQPIDLTFSTVLLHVVAPLIGIFSIMYALFRVNKGGGTNQEQKVSLYYLLTAFLLFAADYRILKFLMTGLPFAEGRLWMFQYLTLVPFIAVIAYDLVKFLQSKALGALRLQFPTKSSRLRITRKATTLVTTGILLTAYIFSFASLSGWITVAVYRAYPHYAPLQTTSYELEAARYIDTNTNEKYIVIADQWMIFAGQMIAGVANPRAFYFSHTDLDGVSLFIRMKANPSPEIMTEAMKHNNATVAYFIIEKPRLGTEAYSRIIQQAQQNNLQTYQTFYYQGEEKLCIFYYKKS